MQTDVPLVPATLLQCLGKTPLVAYVKTKLHIKPLLIAKCQFTILDQKTKEELSQTRAAFKERGKSFTH